MASGQNRNSKQQRQQPTNLSKINYEKEYKEIQHRIEKEMSKNGNIPSNKSSLNENMDSVVNSLEKQIKALNKELQRVLGNHHNLSQSYHDQLNRIMELLVITDKTGHVYQKYTKICDGITDLIINAAAAYEYGEISSKFIEESFNALIKKFNLNENNYKNISKKGEFDKIINDAEDKYQKSKRIISNQRIDMEDKNTEIRELRKMVDEKDEDITNLKQLIATLELKDISFKYIKELFKTLIENFDLNKNDYKNISQKSAFDKIICDIGYKYVKLKQSKIEQRREIESKDIEMNRLEKMVNNKTVEINKLETIINKQEREIGRLKERAKKQSKFKYKRMNENEQNKTEMEIELEHFHTKNIESTRKLNEDRREMVEMLNKLEEEKNSERRELLKIIEKLEYDNKRYKIEYSNYLKISIKRNMEIERLKNDNKMYEAQFLDNISKIAKYKLEIEGLSDTIDTLKNNHNLLQGYEMDDKETIVLENKVLNEENKLYNSVVSVFSKELVKYKCINLEEYVKEGREYIRKREIRSKEKNGLNLVNIVVLPNEGAGDKGCIESKDENGDISMDNNNNNNKETIFSIVATDGVEIEKIENLTNDKVSFKVTLGAKYWTK